MKEIKDKYKESNKLIVEFCGGILVDIPMFGKVYQFDDDTSISPYSLRYNEDWNEFMKALKTCKDKVLDHDELRPKYDDLLKSLDLFYIPFIYPVLIEFINQYNDIKNLVKPLKDAE